MVTLKSMLLIHCKTIFSWQRWRRRRRWQCQLGLCQAGAACSGQCACPAGGSSSHSRWRRRNHTTWTNAAQSSTAAAAAAGNNEYKFDGQCQHAWSRRWRGCGCGRGKQWESHAQYAARSDAWLQLRNA